MQSPLWSRCVLPLLLGATLAVAQMESPLQGQGTPELETTEVYVSFYLDRLLKVDDREYTHQNVGFFYITWIDYSAAAKMLASTTKMLNGSACTTPCSNYVRGVTCCDDMYLPAFYFRNAFGFPQDREVGYQIWADTSGVVVWAVFVHGIYFQPMDFRHFPFETFELQIELEFYSTSDMDLQRTQNNITHPGVSVKFSSGGTKLYSTGAGDDTSQWSVVGITLDDNNHVDAGRWFLEYSEVESDPGDPAPLNPAPGTFNCSGTWADDEESSQNGEPQLCNVYSGSQEQIFAVYIEIQRFWRYYLLNSVLPVILCAVLASIIFFLDITDLAPRLEVTVTLFLSLTAVQFVLGDSMPASSYVSTGHGLYIVCSWSVGSPAELGAQVMPTQQLVIATYVFLALVAVESILVYHIATWPQHREAKRRRREGYLRYREALAASKQAEQQPSGGKEATDGGGMGSSNGGYEGGSSGATARAAGAAGSAAAAAAEDASVAAEEGGLGNGQPRDRQDTHSIRLPPRQRSLFSCFRGVAGTPSRQRDAPQRTASFTHMQQDEAYASYVGNIVEIVLACALILGYILAAILIFVLQHGYLDLWSYV
ncbi:hypothetical protein N2152v2_010031 [Parachlorella kessleri]